MFDAIRNFLVGSLTAVVGVVSSFFNTPFASPLQQTTIAPVQQDTSVTAVGSIKESNVTVVVTMHLPKGQEGGPVSGTLSEFCEGQINGDYDGKDNGAVSGTLGGSCGPVFIKVAATGTFNGVVHRSKGQIVLQYEGKTDKYKKSGTVTLQTDPF